MRDDEFSINSANLRMIPQLVNCPRWDQAEFLGRLNYRTDRATYDGGLVKYEGKLYNVNRAQTGALCWHAALEPEENRCDPSVSRVFDPAVMSCESCHGLKIVFLPANVNPLPD